ncbi:MAG TPA: hypothetical protein VN455_05580, partial [Methanotrichaceae archaeon]|nr:hypothetical protein [Methanotrichaceae archaeon]
MYMSGTGTMLCQAALMLIAADLMRLAVMLRVMRPGMMYPGKQIGVGTVKIEIISKALAWSMLVLAALIIIGLGSGDSTQPPRIIWYPDGHLEIRNGDPNDFDQRYLNESQLMQFVAFDDNVIPKKAVTDSAIPGNASFNNASFNNTIPDNSSPLWLRRWKTI